MIKIISVSNVDSFAKKILPKRSDMHEKNVKDIISKIQANGDSALKHYEKKFGNNSKSFRVSKSEIDFAYDTITRKELSAIKTARNLLIKSEQALKSRLNDYTISNGIAKISKSFVPISSVGCYIPGGLARYPSSAIMSITPAKIVNVKRIVAVSPPDDTGKIDHMTLVAADICGADEIYKIGGAQGIAALSIGTKSIKPVDKIVGPGGAFVSTAKSLLAQNTAIDMIAGPTELGILADRSSNARYIALDLISQAEHSTDTFCYVITNSKSLANDISSCLDSMISGISRSDIIKTSLKKNGFIAVCKDMTTAVSLCNLLAPEHLEIITRNSKSLSKKISSPGLILLGENTPSSASDYLLGSNHILPTSGFGKTRGSLSVLDFVKLTTTIETNKKSLRGISKYIESFTDVEQLPNHHAAVLERIK